MFFILASGQNKIHFDKIENKDGVLNDWISNVFEDNKGFIWISTQDGVLRFDGYEFKKLRNSPSNSNSISANWVLQTTQDNNNNFWFGTYGEGLNMLDLKTKSIKRYSKNTENSNFKGSVVTKILSDKNNNLWILSDLGISVKNASNDSITHINNSNQWSHISMTENGKIWSISGGYLYKHDEVSKEPVPIFKISENIDNLESSGDALFFNSLHHGYSFKNGKIKQTIKLPTGIKVISNFKNHSSYFGSNNTIYKYQISNNSLEKIYQFNKDITIESLFIDSKNQLWIGTDKGLYKENKLATKFKHSPIPHNARRIVHKNNTLYLAGNNGLHIYKDNKHKMFLSDKDLISLHVDEQNTIWAGDIRGTLFEIDSSLQTKEHTIAFQEKTNTTYLYAIAEDKKQRLWLGTWNGIYIFNKNGKVLHHFKLKINNKDIEYRILKMLADSNDRLWIIGPTDGVFKIDDFSNFNLKKETLSITNYQRELNKKNTLNSNVIIDIHEDLEQKVWVGTDAGINIYNDETDQFEIIHNKGILFDEKIMSIEHDNKNRIWLGTITKGIFVYNQKNNSFTHYNQNDGLISNAFLFSSNTSDKNGNLYYGTDRGIQIIKPQQFETSTDTRAPLITDFETVNDQKDIIHALTLPYTGLIQVKPPHSNFSISFSSLDFTNNAKINYAFKLEGLNENWQYTKSNLNTAYFTNITKGTYTFKVIAFDTTQGIESGKESTIQILVIPPWYRSNLAYIVYGLLFLGVLSLIYYLQLQRKIAQFKIEQLKEEEEYKLQQLISNFHYLGLTSVFSVDDLDTIKTNQSEIYGILSYFATSLFDKNKVQDVLKDIAKNCISKLHLEDCVIYWLDSSKNVLTQKAAYGGKSPKDEGSDILNPIDIPLGKGIVGTVAMTGIPEIISDLTFDKRYIVDNAPRQSELAVPIFLDGKIAGVIDAEHSKKDFFTKGHLEIFQLLAILLERKLTQISDKKEAAITNDNIYFKELKQVMKKQKLYRNPNISLVSIADELTISPGYLSKLINKITKSNFNDFINSFRVEEVKQKLNDPDFESYSILSIGLESGFNSKSVFYTAFKKHTGFSPTEYKNKNE